MTEKDYLRMIQWLALAAMFYVAAVLVSQPQLQTGLWKLGHITIGGYVGYWLDRHLLGRYVAFEHSHTPRVIARAIIVCAAILGMAFGL